MSAREPIVGQLKKQRNLAKLVLRARRDPDILAIILFGSLARGQSNADSDVDVCLVLAPLREAYPSSRLVRKRLQYLEFDLDVHLFQQLPLYIRSRVLKEGKVLWVKDEDLLYNLALRTVREFEDFKPIYKAYLEDLERAG